MQGTCGGYEAIDYGRNWAEVASATWFLYLVVGALLGMACRDNHRVFWYSLSTGIVGWLIHVLVQYSFGWDQGGESWVLGVAFTAPISAFFGLVVGLAFLSKKIRSVKRGGWLCAIALIFLGGLLTLLCNYWMADHELNSKQVIVNLVSGGLLGFFAFFFYQILRKTR